MTCGAEAFLVQLVAKEAKRKLVEDILVVAEFADIFVDDLSKLPCFQKLSLE